MDFRQFYLGCLSHASYYVGSGGAAAIIDPQRDVEQYIEEAASHGHTIKYVIETHSHADFVSGHVELAARTGARIVYGERANTKFETLKVRDGDVLNVGDVKLTFRETPGHTPEGITIIAEEGGAPPKVFTGDTLFIGDVGRPDLIGSKGFTSEEMAAMLYDSLYEKILPLPDTAEIYPAHGAGSLCGKSLSKETWSTLGEQRKFNYALQPMSREEFVKIVAAGQTAVPQYFPKSAARNLEGSPSLDEIPAPRVLTTDEVLAFDGVVIDVRKNFEYGAGHVPNSINIGLGGQFASWAGTLVPIGTPTAIVATTREQVDEAVMRLARVGHETVSGFILFENYVGDQDAVEQVSVSDANEYVSSGRNAQFIDVRRQGEYESGHAPGADSRPLDTLERHLDNLDPATPTYVICQGGYRSSIACGILENAGFNELYNVTGGTAAWIEAELPVETETGS
ncbi:MAG TPA: rhodanese-like domain-containing protein [Pyrinomonadaceae bacterium]|jgi:glyoxylase-like metal-dependent hydrolase (beta-lactamase superfamily II)/rhodanese-related sulfurtransferase|nr:rhodanese-like domain-containing protein [Pyrinomonadaceae bacterium]